ncbi:two-component system response regulator [Microbacterium sp. B35-04]|uniref:response regulator n=1 Tax=unclassified Microbacterium TaxID=2609290 RepID=UPI0013D3DC2A|nr:MULTISPECIES: response regulator [unclassified Microbacterium]KAF2414505.1 two-component system response regulator [Microbacterium sp. B35-04]KAF2417294.1 two-component system response regulator [Microbacterium sp. B35-30]
MNRPIRVLVVDDDFRVAGLHRDIVASRPGFTALDAVQSLGAARQAVRAHAPDLLLVDAFLPDGDGVEFAAAADIDAFVLSAATDAATVRRALQAGALAYLTKPFDARVLAERLDRYARMRNLLVTDRPLEQEQIDRALAIMHGGAEPATVTRSATEQLILEGLGDDEASAAEIADRVGISRATAQRHLAGLASRGLVDVRLRYGTTGRPEHRYIAVRR